MFQTPDYSQKVSLRLSEVLDEIGVNERTVMKRRRASLLKESMGNIRDRSLGINYTTYFLGSESEGTTTLGLDSDLDILVCSHDYNVMQYLSEWKQGMTNLLMIQDETTTPGYCFLQLYRVAAPLPMINCPNDEYISDRRGRILMKNNRVNAVQLGGEQHGPSCAMPGGKECSDRDFVTALPCESWPRSGAGWLERQGLGRWPTTEMKRYAVGKGFFVVPVGSKISANKDLEWRISTSLAERCLMFNLNITQIRCYILMKMVLKTLTNHQGENNLSSFMCKTVLLHFIENTESNTWKENNLLTCLTYCFIELYNCIYNDSCSHFIIIENNLMAGQFLDEVKHHTQGELSDFIQSDGQALLQIQTDDLGVRLQNRMDGFCQTVNMGLTLAEIVCANAYLNLAGYICQTHANSCNSGIYNIERLKQHIYTIVKQSKNLNRLEKTACSLFLPLFCTTLGTCLASSQMELNQPVLHEALEWLSAGLNSDILSSRLKLASVYYSAGYEDKAELILRHALLQYKSKSVQQMCICWKHQQPLPGEFAKNLVQQNEDCIAYINAYCVKFWHCELNCVPLELQYEMFRSTQEELRHRDREEDYWMDWAVVDPLPYLCFLQYKTFGQLKRYQDQQQALSNLMKTIKTEPNLWHRETALNLLGQCMEQENKPREALRYYILSLNVRTNNNAARILICCLLAKYVSQR